MPCIASGWNRQKNRNSPAWSKEIETGVSAVITWFHRPSGVGAVPEVVVWLPSLRCHWIVSPTLMVTVAGENPKFSAPMLTVRPPAGALVVVLAAVVEVVVLVVVAALVVVVAGLVVLVVALAVVVVARVVVVVALAVVVVALAVVVVAWVVVAVGVMVVAAAVAVVAVPTSLTHPASIQANRIKTTGTFMKILYASTIAPGSRLG